MSKLTIIGLYGKMGSGKSVFCEAFPHAYYNATREKQVSYYASMSTDMKMIVEAMTGVQMRERKEFVRKYDAFDYIFDYSSEDKAKLVDTDLFGTATIGGILQAYALLVKQTEGDTKWIDMVLRDIPKHATVAIIDGVRYKSDVDAIEKAGGHIVKIHRDMLLTKDGRSTEHKSETDLDTYDNFKHVFHNQECMTRYGAVHKMSELIKQAYENNKRG